jgi:hypothetical protein
MFSFAFPLRRLCRAGAVLALAFLTSACASFYVDPVLPKVEPKDIVKPAWAPAPVQLLVEFKTNGAANAGATQQVRPMVVEAVSRSGLFSEVSAEPVAGGRVLSVSINNVANMSDAAAKGFLTGLTFGAAGNMVTDGYVCDMNYTHPGAPSRTATVKHAMHTQMGAGQVPPTLKPVPSAIEGVKQIVDQMVLTGLKQMTDPAAPATPVAR